MYGCNHACAVFPRAMFRPAKMPVCRPPFMCPLCCPSNVQFRRLSSQNSMWARRNGSWVQHDSWSRYLRPVTQRCGRMHPCLTSICSGMRYLQVFPMSWTAASARQPAMAIVALCRLARMRALPHAQVLAAIVLLLIPRSSPMVHRRWLKQGTGGDIARRLNHRVDIRVVVHKGHTKLSRSFAPRV